MAEFRQGVWRVACVLAVGAIGLAACARDVPEGAMAHRYGSLKDDPADYAKPARFKPARSRATSEARSETPPKVLPPLRQAAIINRPRVTTDKPAPAAATKAMSPATPSAPTPPPAPAPQAEKKPLPASQARPERPAPQVVDPKDIERMLVEGKALFDGGQVVDARRRFVAAMNGPLPDVLLALARSYDTYYLSRLPKADAAPDMQRALVLYERAAARGAIEAMADLERTRSILKIPR
jgi:hypothetical protein